VIDIRFATRLRLPLILCSVLLTLAWGMRRLQDTLALAHDDAANPYTLLLALLFAMFACQLLLAWRERPYTVSPEDEPRIERLSVCLNLPVYNEDPGLLHRVLTSIFAQSRLPDRVELVDDGSKVDYSALRARWLADVPEGVEFSWVRTENRGKRHAQMETFGRAREDILVTIDSDTILHRRAIEEGLKPFADPEVTSVAGLVLALNKHTNTLTRVQDLVVTTWQLTLRSAYSMLRSVTVNSGPFALYRGAVIRQAADGYLNERIAGRPVQFSDDSLLTLYALMRGRTVQQPSAIAFSAWPETLSHHLRQQVRWTRGSFIRSLWRLRYLPLRGVAFWLHLIGHAQFLASTVMLVFVFCIRPHIGLHHLAPMLMIAMLLSYATTVRTLTVRRSDETLGQQLGVYALSPLVVLWALFVYRPLRLFGMVSCLRTGWGTRQTVETPAVSTFRSATPVQPAAPFALADTQRTPQEADLVAV
jgi:hyaluronan synthase